MGLTIGDVVTQKCREVGGVWGGVDQGSRGSAKPLERRDIS